MLKDSFRLLIGLILVLIPVYASEDKPDKYDPLGELFWRNVGPINPSGRVADVEGLPGNPKVVYVGSASGGIWKTENGGLTFEPIFDHELTASIGDLALAPSNPDVIYAGTGESNVRNSVSFGNGVYKSTDGGRHWSHLGLEETRHISRVVVDPADPDTVFVGALGHIYGENEERGVYKSTDGGKTWTKSLYIDATHGVADMDISPGNGNVLFAAMWHFQRNPWDHKSGSEKGGVYKSIDGGKSWRKITKGLPKLMGRIGVKIAPSNPNVVYVIAESNDGILFRSDDAGESFTKVNDNVRIVSRGFYYTDIRVDPTNENNVFAIASRLYRSMDGGKSFQRFSRTTHVDYHSLWIDPLDPNRMWQGQDGGVAVSYDRGDSWEPIRNLPLAQFYQIYADNREPFYYLGGGLQDNGTWYGPSRTREPAGIMYSDWRMSTFGDAYFVVPHPDEPEIMITESQGGRIMKTDMRNRHTIDISPQPKRNDGGPVGELEYRFNWNAPIIASPYDPLTIYFAGNVVFKSKDFGDTWEIISPDLTTNDPEKQGEAGGPVWKENTTAEYHCTIISFDESPVEQGVLWVGTDDGNLQLSRNGGKDWKNITAQVKDVPEFSPVSHVEPSRTKGGKAYIAFDRHMFDDFRPHIYKTENYGKSWKRIVAGIPDIAYVHVVKEDPKNADILYAGTEIGLYASFDNGDTWRKLHLKNLPTVAVHDIVIHPKQNDLIVGTHGRGIWVLDDATPIQNLAAMEKVGKPSLFEARPGLRFTTKFTRYGMGDKKHKAPNPPYGVEISYYLPEPLKKSTKTDEGEKLKLEILDKDGKLVKTIKKLPGKKGVNRIAWAMDGEPPRPRNNQPNPMAEFFGAIRGPFVLPGTYTARLSLGDVTSETPVEVRIDPSITLADEAGLKLNETVLKLREMSSEANDVLRVYDALSAQLKARKKTMKALEVKADASWSEASEAFEKAMKENMAVLTRLPGKPFWSQGPKHSERVSSLMFGLNNSFQELTSAQLAFLDELEADHKAMLASYEDFLAKNLGDLNTALSGAGLAPLVASASK